MIAALSVVVASVFGTQSAADAGGFQFAAPPSQSANWVYRVDSESGEMGLCWFTSNDGIGLTTCLPAGEGAGPQEPGRYRLVATNLLGEPSIFRVDELSGRVSICYLREEVVVCTPQQ